MTMRDPETKFALGFIALWLFAILVKLSIIGGIIYVAVHFISKYW